MCWSNNIHRRPETRQSDNIVPRPIQAPTKQYYILCFRQFAATDVKRFSMKFSIISWAVIGIENESFILLVSCVPSAGVVAFAVSFPHPYWFSKCHADATRNYVIHNFVPTTCTNPQSFLFFIYSLILAQIRSCT